MGRRRARQRFDAARKPGKPDAGDALRRKALRHTQFATASVATIRLKLFKIGALVRTSVRRIHFAMASGCPNQIEFATAYTALTRAFGSS